MENTSEAQNLLINQFLGEYLGSSYKLTEATGGVVHHVYKVTSSGTIYYLKLRGDRFAKIPTIECRPEDIEYEYRALKHFHGLAPDSFPVVLAYDRRRAMMLLSSIMTPEINLEFLLNAKAINDKAVGKIAYLIASIHNKLSSDSILIRGVREQECYDSNLHRRLLSLGRESLVEVVKRLHKQRKQIIFGDLSVKNMAIDNNGVYICDLDHVHYGNVLFDVGFLAGHLLLHTFNHRQSHLAESFLDSYFDNTGTYINEDDEDLLVRIIIGACIYRLDNAVVPYSLPNLSNDERKEILKRLDALLDKTSLKIKLVGRLKV